MACRLRSPLSKAAIACQFALQAVAHTLSTTASPHTRGCSAGSLAAAPRPRRRQEKTSHASQTQVRDRSDQITEPLPCCHCQRWCTNALACAAVDPPAARPDVHREPQQYRSPADHIIAQLTSDLASSRSEIKLLKAQLSAAAQQDGGDSAAVAELQEQIERLQQRLAAAQGAVEESTRGARSASEAAALQQDALAAVSPASVALTAACTII